MLPVPFGGEEGFVFAVTGDYHELLPRPFSVAPVDRASLGCSTSTEPTHDLAHLCEGIAFLDYIMEGFVTYLVRARAIPCGLEPDVRITSSNRDEFVAPSLWLYIRWAGLEAVR